MEIFQVGDKSVSRPQSVLAEKHTRVKKADTINISSNTLGPLYESNHFEEQS